MEENTLQNQDQELTPETAPERHIATGSMPAQPEAILAETNPAEGRTDESTDETGESFEGTTEGTTTEGADEAIGEDGEPIE